MIFVNTKKLPNEIIEKIVFYTYNIFTYFDMYIKTPYNNIEFYNKRYINILKTYEKKYIDTIKIYKENKNILVWIKEMNLCLSILNITSYEKIRIINCKNFYMINYFYDIFDDLDLSLLYTIYPNKEFYNCL